MRDVSFSHGAVRSPMADAADAGPGAPRQEPSATSVQTDLGSRLLPGAFVLVTGLFLTLGAGAFAALRLTAGAGSELAPAVAATVFGAALTASAAWWMRTGSMTTAAVTRAVLGIWLLAVLVLAVLVLFGEPFGLLPFLGLLWFAWLRRRMTRWMHRAMAGKRRAGVWP